MIGKTISHYKILEKLGEGGMGVVYKAEDTKLKREVAIKFLPHHIAASEEDRERFKIEAQAAAALNHPNIATIHAIEEVDDELFIVMEYIDGQELKQRIDAGPLKVDEALNIAMQIADGLQAAHKKGVFHRDIKSANIMLTENDRVKIMDFGLAKIKGQMRLTKTGTTVGTVAYMSPEQARGEEVDHRTDIWSYGVVLYEMITGRLPFKGEYEQAIVYSILNEEPEPVIPIGSGLTGVSMELERIVNKAIIKSPDERYQHAEEMLIDLRSVKKVSPPRPEIKKSPKAMSKPLLGILTILFLFALIIVFYLLTRKESREFQIKHTLPLTTAPGLEQDPTWSPEGTRIAYASDETGNMDIWIRQIAAGQKLNLTKDYRGYDGKPAWSPDGEWIAFVSERDGGGIFLISALGGIPKCVVSLSFAPSLSYIGAIPPVCWSPDGRELAYAVAGSLYTIPASGGTPAPVPLPPIGLTIGYSEPAWSPDGEKFACTGFVAAGVSTSRIWSMKCDGSDPISITHGKAFNSNPIWSPNRRQLFFLSDRGGSQDVWWLPVDARGKPTGPARPLTAGIGIGAIALSSDGMKLAYTKIVERSNIWSIPIVPDRILTLTDAQPLTTGKDYIENLHFSPDGQWIAYDSNRRGNMDIWIMHRDGSELRQLTTSSAHDWIPQWSPDGKKIMFHTLRSGNRDLFVIPVGGGAIKQLTNHPAEDLSASWSPDGKRIAFVSNRNGNMDVWVMSSDGGEPQQLTFNVAMEEFPLWFPDGKRLIFCSKRTGRSELFLIPSEGGEAKQLTHGAWSDIYPIFWSSDGRTVYAYGQGGPGKQGANLWAISVSDGTARPLMDFSGSLKEPGYTLDTDGERIYFTLWERLGDLWMAELATNE